VLLQKIKNCFLKKPKETPFKNNKKQMGRFFLENPGFPQS